MAARKTRLKEMPFPDLVKMQTRQVKQLVEKRGVGNLKKLYVETRRRLKDELDGLLATGKGERYEAHHARVMLRHAEQGVADVQAALGSVLAKRGAEASAMAIDHLDEQIKRNGEKYGTEFHAPIDKADLLYNVDEKSRETLMRRFDVSVQKYGLDAISRMEQEMAVGLMSGRTVEQMSNAVLGANGALDGEYWKAERIARTEIANAYGYTTQVAMQESQEMFPGVKMGKVWVSVLETGGPKPRTCQQCEDMDGVVVGVDDPFIFPDGTMAFHPPKHPNCLCGSTLTLLP